MKLITFSILTLLLAGCIVNVPSGSAYKPKKLIKECKTYIGTPYKFGGNTNKGIDCSGLIYNSLNNLGYSIPRISYQQAEAFKEVKVNRLKKGDLLYFITSGNRINHTGVITKIKSAGEVYFVHASTKGGVRIDNLHSSYWYPKFVKATRPEF